MPCYDHRTGDSYSGGESYKIEYLNLQDRYYKMASYYNQEVRVNIARENLFGR